jgi:hypothetical protein
MMMARDTANVTVFRKKTNAKILYFVSSTNHNVFMQLSKIVESCLSIEIEEQLYLNIHTQIVCF